MFFLAMRQMVSRKKQTVLIFLGISFSAMIYVVIAGIQLGMRQYLAEQLLNNTAHIRISGREAFIVPEEIEPRVAGAGELMHWIVPPSGRRDIAKLENPQGWFDRLRHDPVVVDFAPRFSVDAILARGQSKWAVGFVGIEPERQVRVTSLEDYMREGSLLDLRGGGKKMIVGSGVLKQLGARLGEFVSVTLGDGDTYPFKIVGVLHLGSKELDERLVLGYLTDVQQINKTPGRISEISVALVDINQSKRLAAQWALYGSDKVESWEEANAAFMQIIIIQDVVRLVITISILLVAAFGIYNVLSIMINQKQKEIAILRSIGYAPARIMELFLWQGLTMGISGAIFGMLLGLGVNLLVGHIDLGFDIGKGRSLLISYAPSIYSTALLMSVMAAVVASFFPARHASKMTPLDIIRANL
ncbi:MAG: ABC transporter permease [Deltaproteobacteria bacterium]|nr:ABC transporter permease [Deltaproteobacteria bacterium]